MLKKIDKKILKIIGITIGIIIILIVGALLINLLLKERYDYRGIEKKMVSASKEYYNSNKTYLPQIEGNTTEVTLETLVSSEYMKNPGEYLGNKDVSCTGRVTVTKLEDNYRYAPYLDCGAKYKTTYLASKLRENIVTTGAGLYAVDQYVGDKEGVKNLVTNHIFKGEILNNYITVDDTMWRIVKVNNDDSIVLIFEGKDPEQLLYDVWDDRYNADRESKDGINNYSVSRAREKLSSIYQGEFLPTELKNRLVKQNLCIGKRKEAVTTNDGSIECSTILAGEYLGLLPAYDYINASLDSNCKSLASQQCSNYNYLLEYDKSWWLLTTDADTTFKGYKAAGEIVKSTISGDSRLRLVITLDPKTILTSGTGSQEDPYIVK